MRRDSAIILGALLLCVALCVASYLNGKKRGFAAAREAILSRTDTTYIHDTITDPVPVPVYCHTVDTMLVPVPVPGEHTTDTVYVTLPREQKVYQGEDYRAYISGYRPQLDSISIVRSTAVVERYIETTRPHRLSIGIQGGYGITPAGPQPYIGVGLQLNIINIK